MKRAIFLCAILAASAVVLRAQQANQSTPYAGVSTPPPNDTITDEAPPQPAPAPVAHPAKPSPDRYATTTPPAPAQQEVAPPNRIPPDFITSANSDGTDAGIVEPPAASRPAAAQPSRSPATTARLYASDPDGDIVHPQPLPPGELGAGTVIRVRMLSDLASGINHSGDAFRGTIIRNVFEDGSLMIPAGSELDGRVARVSPGEGLGSDCSMTLHPETVILPDGTRYQIYAMVSATPASHNRIGPEGEITPGLQVKRDSISYGAGVGAGAATGAIIGGPVGALAGTVIGAAAVTVHLLTSHPQANIDTGAPVEFTLTQPLNLVPVTQNRTDAASLR
ncbi:MAG: hypothetical protein ACRD25_07425 [Terracidiphilus sp.]